MARGAKETAAQKFERLQGELKEAKAALSKEKRKERNKQLMALGIYLEQVYKMSGMEVRNNMRRGLENYTLNPKVKALAMDGFKRVDNDSPPVPAVSKPSPQPKAVPMPKEQG